MHKLLLFLILASTLAACGLKGPLYIPAPKPAAAPPATAAAPPASGATPPAQSDDKKETPVTKSP